MYKHFQNVTLQKPEVHVAATLTAFILTRTKENAGNSSTVDVEAMATTIVQGNSVKTDVQPQIQV